MNNPGDVSPAQRTPADHPPVPTAWWVVVLLLVLATLVVFAATLPAYYRFLVTLQNIDDPAYRSIAANNLAQAGVGTPFYAAFYVSLALVPALVCIGLTALILWRRPRDRMALFTALVVVLFGVTFTGPMAVLQASDSPWRLVGYLLSAASMASIFLFLFVFPSGHVVPRWVRWPVVIFAGYLLVTGLFPATPIDPNTWSDTTYALFMLGWIGAGVLAQVYRFRRVSTLVERQQTRWVIWGFASALLGYALVLVVGVVLPQKEPGTAAELIAAAFAATVALFVPISIALAILRYRLWDLGIVIRRTLSYTVLTALLAVIFFGTVTLLTTVLSEVSGLQSELIVVVSTLLIAALFNPLRHRIQNTIDRRFFRPKYDAQAVLAHFAHLARDETDLDALTKELVHVIQEALQPEQARVWLRQEQKR